MTSQFGGRHHSTMPVGDRDAVDVDAVMRVTPGDVLVFAEEAFRNMAITDLSLEDIDDLQRAMQSTLDRIIARAALTPENPS